MPLAYKQTACPVDATPYVIRVKLPVPPKKVIDNVLGLFPNTFQSLRGNPDTVPTV